MAYDFRNASILIAEDNLPMLELVRSVVNTFGFEKILTAKNGKEGFQLFCEHSPDLVIADWMMKPINGITMTHMIRNDPRSPNFYVPVILMTGFSQKKRVIEARDSGITEFIVKPFKAQALYKRIESVIEQPRQFVKSSDFFGPDRRRKKDLFYQGPFRRETDNAKEIAQKRYSLQEENKMLNAIMQQEMEHENENKTSSIEIDFIERNQ